MGWLREHVAEHERRRCKPGSWVIVERETRQAVLETFDARVAEKVNRDRYEAVPILEYLQSINRRARS